MAHIGKRRPGPLIMAAGLAVALLVACSPDRVEVQPTSRAAVATAGSCDPGGMTAAWAAFVRDFNNRSVDIDTYFAPDFQVWVDPTNQYQGGASRPQLAQHLADMQQHGAQLPTDVAFVLDDRTAGTYEYGGTFHAVAQLNCITGRIRTVAINNWPPGMAGTPPY
jgi:hypothetical protein